MKKNVVVYHQPGCPPCEWVMDFLKRHDVPFESRDIREDRAAMRDLVEAGIQSTPALFVDGNWLIGFEPEILKDVLGLK